MTRRLRRGLGLLGSWLVLLTRPGFDVGWYEQQRGVPATRPRATLHYLVKGGRRGLTPHPLFDPDVAPESFVQYVRGPRSRRTVPTHALFDVVGYLHQAPEALGHRGGPIEHYRQDGARRGLAPNDWFDTAWGGGAGLVGWIEQQAAERLVRSGPPRVTTRFDRQAADQFVAGFAGVVPRRDPAFEVLVTVVVPVRDRAGTVGAAIESVLGQTLRDLELVVVDDGSTDAIEDAVRPYRADARFELVRMPAGGVARARNEGAARARGQYLAWLDSDDTWTPEHLRVLVAYLQREGLRAGYDVLELHAPGQPVRYRALDAGLGALLVSNHIGQPVLVHERALFHEVGGFDEGLPRTVDHDLVLRMAATTRIGYAPFVGCVVNHDPSDTSRISTSLPGAWGEVVLNRYLVDWAGLRESVGRPRPAGSVTVVVIGAADWRPARVDDVCRALFARGRSEPGTDHDVASPGQAGCRWNPRLATAGRAIHRKRRLVIGPERTE